MGFGDAQGSNKDMPTVNLDMDQPSRGILDLGEKLSVGAPVAIGVGERKRKGHVALHFASSCFTLPRTRARAWTR